MKKLLVSLLIGISLLGVGCGKEVGNGGTKKLSAYEINEITSLSEEVTESEDWYLYYGGNEIEVSYFMWNPELVEPGTIFGWTYTFEDYITKNDEGLLEYSGEELMGFNYRDVVFNNLDQVISEEFMTKEEVNDRDAFLGVFEITEVTEDKVYVDVMKTVLCKGYFDPYFEDVYEDEILVEIY